MELKGKWQEMLVPKPTDWCLNGGVPSHHICRAVRL
jgi:hypothetical protein